MYTCQLFLNYRRDSFILRVPGFSIEFWKYPKMSKGIRVVLSNMNTRTQMNTTLSREKSIIDMDFFFFSLVPVFKNDINPFAPGVFAEKRVLKLVEWFPGHCFKELKLTTNRFTGCTLHGLLMQMQNISLRSSGMCRKQNFEIVFGFKSDTAVLTFTFCFHSSPLFSLFLPHFFFSCWAFSRLCFGGKSF